MSDLTPVGVTLVAENSATFDKAILGASRALGVLDKAGQAVSKSFGVVDQIVIGALRRIGALGVDALVRAGREVLRFGQRLIEAAAAGTPLESSLDKLYRSLVDVTRASLSPFFDQLDGLIQRAAPKVLGFASVIGTYLGGIASNALTWGSNIVTQLAQGMLDGAVAVLDALISIGNMITSWLMPGSPPKLLPDLDKWGTEAANVWLQGWTKANFSIFTSLAGPLESLIRSTAAPGGKDSGLIPRILGAREGIAQAVDELRTAGQVSQSTLDTIIAQVGTADQGVRAFLEATIGLEAANQNVAAAQANLNRVMAEYDALLKPIEDQLAGIDEATQQFAEDQKKGMLAFILADPNATAAEKRRAQLELERIDAERARRALLAEKADAVDTAQGELDAAETAQAAAQQLYDTQAAQLQLQIDQNNLLKEQLSLLEKIAAVASGATAPKGGGAGKGGGGKLFGIDTSGITDAIDLLMGKFDELFKAWEGPINHIMSFLRTQWGIAFPAIMGNIDSIIDSLGELWEKHGEKVVKAINAIIFVAFTALTVSLTFLTGVVAAGLNIMTGDWEGAKEDIIRTATSIKDQVNYLFLRMFGITLGDMENWLDDLGERLTVGLNLRKNQFIIFVAQVQALFLTDEWYNIGSSIIAGIAQGVLGAAHGLVNAVVTSVLQAISAAQGVIAAALGVGGSSIFDSGGANSNGTSHPSASASNIASNVTTNNASNVYNYAPTYGGAPANPSTDFALMQVWAS